MRPWFSSGQEWTVAGEPESAAWWFPSNDHPSDVALMDISIRVPAGLQAISIGRLESADSWYRRGLRHVALEIAATAGDLPCIPLHREVPARARDGRRSSVRLRGLHAAIGRGPEAGPCAVATVWIRYPDPGADVRSVPLHRNRWCGTRPSTAVRWSGDPDPPCVQRCFAAERRLRARAHRSRASPHVVRRQRDCAGMERHLQQRGVRIVGPVGSC